MNKWCGYVGFAESIEYEPGCYEDQITEHQYMGDIINNSWKRQSSQGINDDINLSNKISIVADPFALRHCEDIIYVTYMNAKWKVTEIDTTQYPRLILAVGGVYNGNPPGTTE